MDIADGRWQSSGSNAACHAVDGTLYNFSDNYANKSPIEINRTLAVMNAASPWWQTAVSDEAKVLVQDYGASGAHTSHTRARTHTRVIQYSSRSVPSRGMARRYLCCSSLV